MEPNRSTDNTTFHAFFLRRLIIIGYVIWLFMEIQIKAYAYTIDIITEIRYFCKCNNAVFGKFRIIFTYAISKTDSSLHRSSHALFKISGNGKFVRTAVLPPRPSHNLRKSTPHHPSQNRTVPRSAPHSCLPCQREVAWRQGTNCRFVASCLRYAHPFYIANFSAVKTEGLLHHQPFLAPTPLPINERTACFAVPLPSTITLAFK